MWILSTLSFYIEIVKVCSHVNSNQEDGSSEDILLTHKGKYYNLTSDEQKTFDQIMIDFFIKLVDSFQE